MILKYLSTRHKRLKFVTRLRLSGILTTLAVLVALSLNVGQALTQDQTPTSSTDIEQWTPARNIGKGWFQSTALDLQGNLHVVYYAANDNSPDELEYQQRREDGTWITPTDIFCPCGSGVTVRNSITVSDDGHVGVTYRASDFSIKFSSALFSLANQPQMWSEPVTVGSGYYTNIITDSKGVLHTIYGEEILNPDVRYREDNKCFMCSDVMYRRSTDGGQSWSIPQNLSETPDGSERMQIFQGASSRLYVAWSEGFDGFQSVGKAKDVRLRYSEDEGMTWSAPIILDGGNFSTTKPINLAVAEMLDGSIMVVWRYDSEVSGVAPNFYYQVSSDLGKTWTQPAIVPGFAARTSNTNKYDDITLVIDRLGIVHLFAVGTDNYSGDYRNHALYHAQYAQGTWYRVTRVFYRQDEAPEWPRAVIGRSNDIHLTWFTRGLLPDSECNTCILKVYYSYLAGNMAPQPTRAFLPTNTPLPTPTVFQYIEPTNTLNPTLAGVPTELNLTTQDNYVAQSFLGGLLAVTLFCGAILLIIRFRR